ncbi:MAG: ATP-binding protein [Rhodothermales bacterium]
MSLDALLTFVSNAAGPSEPEQELAFVEADASGRVISLNPQARLAWNWRAGTSLPTEICLAMADLPADEPTDLPIAQDGLRLRAMAKEGGDGWFIVGYAHGGAHPSGADLQPSVASFPNPSPRTNRTGQPGRHDLMDRLPGPAMRLGASGLASYVNQGAARALGEEGPSLLGRPALAEILHSEDRWKIAELMEVAAGNGAAQSAVRYGRDARHGILHVVQDPEGAYDVLIVDTSDDRPGTDAVRHALRELATSCADPWMFRDGALQILETELELRSAVLYVRSPGGQDLVRVGHSAAGTDSLSAAAVAPFMERGGMGTPTRPAAPAWTAPVRDNGTWIGVLVLEWPPDRTLPTAQSLDELAGLFESLYSWIQVGVRYRTSVNAIDDALFGFSFSPDEQRIYHFATHQIEQLTGRSVALLTSGQLDWTTSIVVPEDASLVRAHNKNLLAGNESRITYRVHHTDGSVRWLREHATPQVEASGHLSINGMLADVTEQKTAEMVLVQAKREAELAARAKTSFIATMSHEIRTPLGAVNGFAQLLQREMEEFEEELGEDLPEQIHEFVAAIGDRSQKLLSLVHDLFELSNLEMGQTTVQQTSVNIAPILQRVADRLEPLVADRPVDLRLEMNASRYLVSGDARRIEQVFENLASNAAKFTEEGEIVFEVLDASSEIEIRLRDTGVGISDDYRDELFDAFSQEEDWKNRRFEGTGLGLALVKRLLTLMGGRISVESEKGAGSTFIVRLPKAEAEEDGDRPARTSTAAPGWPERFGHSA